MVNYYKRDSLPPLMPGPNDDTRAALQVYQEMERRKQQALQEQYAKQKQFELAQQQQSQQEQDQMQQQPIEDLYRMLIEKFANSQRQYTPGYQGMSDDFMRGRADSITSAQYDPQISAIQQMISQAQGRAEKNKGELANMYGALSSAYDADVPKVQALYDDASQKATARQDALSQKMNANYDAQRQTVNDEAAKLGQQAAAQETLQPMQSDQNFLQGLSDQIASQDKSNLDLLRNANVSYTQQGGRLAGLEGNNRQADLMSQLEDYVNQQNAGIQSLNNAKGADFAKLMYDMQMQDMQGRAQEAQAAQAFNAQQDQSNWAQLMDIFGIRMKMAEAQNGGGADPSDLINAQRLDFDKQNAMSQAILSLMKEGKSFEEAMALVNQMYLGAR